MIRLATTIALFLAAGAALADPPFRVGLPVDCAMGETCFVQQMPDMDGGPGAKSPFCRSATYDGHKGTDIRVATMADLERGIPVVAAAPGTVIRVRDGMEDRLVSDREDRTELTDRECGNGVHLRHEDGWETRYCHLKRDSVAVKPGDPVEAGATLGMMGASGLTQFPHVHFEVRRSGTVIDPYTGQTLGSGCWFDGNRIGSLWSVEARDAVDTEPTQILAGGLAAGPVDHDDLTDRHPALPDGVSDALVGWITAINLEPGDRVAILVVGVGNRRFAGNATEALDRSKAAYSVYAGRRGAPRPGEYEVRGRVVRNGKVVAERVYRLHVESSR